MADSLRGTLAIALTLTLTFGPALSASANCCGWSYSAPVVDCCGCTPVVVDCCGYAPAVVECCEEVVVHEDSSCGCGTVESAPTTAPEKVESAKPEMADPSLSDIGLPTPQPVLGPEEDVVDPKPMAEEPVAVEDCPVAPLGVPTDTVAPAETEVEPVDPLFGAAEETPVEPAVEETEAEDDLGGMFDEPAEDAAPVEDSDDMFGEPTEEDTAPVEDSDDMFGDALEEDTVPAEDSDDMFSEPVEEDTAPAEDPGDMFGEPADESNDDVSDDLFGAPAEDAEGTEEAAPAEEQPAETEEDDDIFGEDFFSGVKVPARLQVEGGLQSSELRQWTDNTARYHCQARLIGVAPGEVILHKANGKQKRVSLRRLSQQDLQFVYGQVAAHTEYLAKQSAAKKLASR